MKSYDIAAYPASRLATFDVGTIARRRHDIAGLIEVDVTLARQRIRKRIRSGEDISFMAWFLKVLAKTLEEYPHMHAINARRCRQVLFHDVDISLPIERELEGKRVPLVTLVRHVNKKTIEEIGREIRCAASKSIDSEKDYILSDAARKRGAWKSTLFYRFPQWLRMIVWKGIMRNPFVIQKHMGTVIVTNVGGSGRFPGWIIPKTIHNLCVGLGSITKKPWVVGNEIVVREILHMTLLFNHDVVDGVPAARFSGKLTARLEQADEL
ncbi:2-oxo acid dehydrogenase subunit E2 [Sediminispirochaeta bajacaliforniensis]|uniref:2-oxo acid dehydrogenase subunit E2 n=1 Tax=Sediminispirochaeta bajacaliforniensis TaxID=148 RepID=UPI00035F3702|nr:2-oxo acid dehydrogenase subunit E2 [Sediminispirochaeta bajacaliforniensis]